VTAIVTVYAVFADTAEACRIGGVVVAEGLAACVNVLGDCHSIYRWQGKIEVAAEAPALFKARADRADALVARIAELHSYEVPAIVVWPIADALPRYARWVAGEE
jgi:periplasmic divalent cation tolerance protein